MTNDLNSFEGVSLTADRTTLVTARNERRAGVWIGDGAATKGDEVLPPVPVRGPLFDGIAWAGDRLLYPASGESIMSVVPGGGDPEPVATGFNPAATPDGGTIVFVDPQGRPLKKANADGRHVTTLVPSGVFEPVITVKGQVVFNRFQDGGFTPWIVSIDDGEPTQIARISSRGIDVSPDGRLIAFVSQSDGKGVIVVCDLPACTSRRTFTPPASAGVALRWTPNGRGVAYVDAATQMNLWIQPLDGKPPHQLTRFSDGRTIASFAWSRDGRRLAVARANVTNDIVLMKGFKH